MMLLKGNDVCTLSKPLLRFAPSRKRCKINRCRKRRLLAVRATLMESKAADAVLKDYATYMAPLYQRPERVFVSGNGSTLVDADGNQFLDFSGGIAVNALGHADPRFLDAVVRQASKISHSSNLFHTAPAIQLAKRLVQNSFADKIFFCNSGTEANEAAIKFARKWAAVQAGIDPYDPAMPRPTEIVSFTSGFHGRTMGALAITPKQKYQTPFLPMMPGSRIATFNDLESAKTTISDQTCAVFVEPIQGEGGVNIATSEFLQGLRDLCDENRCLLVFDEVQCGLGRTGKLWAHLHYGIEPDIMTLAKPLAGGLPMGAVLITENVANALKPGDHGTTFGGNPLVCHVANTVFDIISEPIFLNSVEQKGQMLKERLREVFENHPEVKEIRGSGLLIGIQCEHPVSEVVSQSLELGLIVITAGNGDVIRLVPPLNVTEEEIESCVQKLISAFEALSP